MKQFLMKHSYKLIIVILVLINVFTLLGRKNEDYVAEYTISTNNQEHKISSVDLHKSKILVYYPKTNYSKLNRVIDNKMERYIADFKGQIKDVNVQKDQYYTLIIFYDAYQHDNYISYVFYIETDTGGAHPNHEIWTISYDTKTDKIISINDLLQKNKNLLDVLSKFSRKTLMTNNRIVDTTMMMEGTRPNKENFSNFAFSPDGLLLFFPQYQVAPYSSGSFVITVPYNLIK